ncbi:monocarboxylate transporter 14-like [Onthophagus taurus]|uniref:monocarboxylate transporter 14-like n=1 Tax=Onthophagus taurus TaxID=166361 RepID=UPI0039BEAD5F
MGDKDLKNASEPLIEKKSKGIITTTENETLKVKNGNSSPKNGTLIPAEVHFMDEESAGSSKLSLSDDDETESRIVTRSGPNIPDGGWGWMVVLSSLLLSMIADGISFSFGLLYIEFLYEYGESKSVTSWIGSLFLAVPLLTGPIMSALVDRYGCRLMTIVGGLISGLGFVLSSFCRTITGQYITFGVIAGLGLGLIYVTAVVSIAYWFDKKRNLAIGLGACGTGFGTFVYAPMTEHFLYSYGWRGTVLLLAGTFFNMCICGALMRDPDWLIEENKLTKSSKKSSTSTTSVSGRSLADDFPDIEELRELLKSGKNTEYLLQSLAATVDENKDEENLKNVLHRSDLSLPTFVKQNEKVPLEVLQHLAANKKFYNVILENYPSLLFSRSISDHRLNKIKETNDTTMNRVPVTLSMKLKKAKDTNCEKKLVHQHSMPNNNKESMTRQRKTSLEHIPTTKPITRSDSVSWFMKQLGMNTHHHFKNIKLHRNSVMHRGAMLNIHKYRLRASSCPNIYRNSMITLAPEEEEKWYDEFVGLLKDMVDFSLLTEFHFLLMALSTILLFTWFIVPYFYLPELMSAKGYSKSEISTVISAIGLTNGIGMIVLGWAGDQPWTSVTKTYGVCLILCGFCIAGMYLFIQIKYALYTVSILFGWFFASSFSFTPMITADLVPLDRFTIGYGLILLCQGIGNLIGPPIAGLFFDLTKSWAQTFIQSGFWIIISGILILIIPMTTNKRLVGNKPLEMEASEKGSIV